MSVNVAFASNNLQTFDGNHGIIVQDIQHAGKTTKRAQSYALAHANASKIPFIEYPNKPITLTGEIVGTTIADCDAQIDIFNGFMTAQNANLDFDYNGGSLNRRYVATATNIDIQRPGNLYHAKFAVTFTCTQAFGMDTTQTTILNVTGRTAATYSDNYTFLGTAPVQLPIITITITAVTGGTNQLVSVGNNSTGQTISVTRTWTAADVLVIDSTTSTVTVNGVATDFSGAFPQFAPGAGTFIYTDGLTTRTFSYNIVYSVMYV